jgi:phosphoglycerate dehydrogenase-like enzyme
VCGRRLSIRRIKKVKAVMAFYEPTAEFRDLEKEFSGVEFVYPKNCESLAAELPSAEVLVILGTMYSPEVAKAVLDAGRNLKWIQSTTAGVDAFLRRGYPEQALLTKGSRIWDVAVAEHALAFMLAFKRNIIGLERTRAARLWDRERLWNSMASLEGKTVGIAGYGNIGREIAKRLGGFDVTIIVYDQYPNVEDEKVKKLYGQGEFNAFLESSDIVVLMLPDTPQTEYIIDKEQFDHLKPSAILINVARGRLVRESALAEALVEGKIAGAGIDVFEDEPLATTSRLWDLPNVILSPHCAATGDNDIRNTCRLLRENLRHYLDGREPLYRYDRNKGY